MTTGRLTGIALVLLFLLALPASGSDVSGDLSLEVRHFPTGSDGQGGETSVAGSLEVEWYHDWDDGDQRFAFTPFLRWDETDSERRHADVRELYWRRSFSGAISSDLYVGARKVFWGVTESLHLVDIVNQTDLVENLDTEDKLGQPMIQWTGLFGNGSLDLFLLPWFRERTFPGLRGRPSLPQRVSDRPVWESDDEDEHLDWAMRWSQYVGSFDIGVSAFSGTAREPRFEPGFEDGEAVLIPHYDLLDQLGLDFQYTVGDWLLKLEVVARDGGLGRSNAAVGGFEYTFVGAVGSADVGLVVEYQRDNARGFVIGDDDIALGARLTFNDVADTDLLAVTAIDRETGSRFTSIEGNRRIGQNLEIDLEVRLFSEVDPRDSLAPFADEDYVQLEIVWHF